MALKMSLLKITIPGKPIAKSLLKITIPGKPIAKKRPRFARRGKYVVTYNDQETEEGRAFLLVCKQLDGHRPIENPVHIDCHFYMPIPKSTSKIRRKKMLMAKIKHTKKPDLDNLIKFIKDVFNGLVWKDDSQVFALIASKKYSEDPRTEIFIIEDE
jgi:Holliday junction resolvase RusA-like endonuclease